jgi:Ca2+-binding RTX toxin-like protein
MTVGATGGDDQLWGGSGNDTFFYSDHSGNDVVHDFGQTAGDNDLIDLSEMTDLSGFSVDQNANGDAVVHLSASDSITLIGVAANTLSIFDFVF